MSFQVTVRYGGVHQRYHTFVVAAADARAALAAAAERMEPAIAETADLVEVRVSVDPEQRSYVGEQG